MTMVLPPILGALAGILWAHFVRSLWVGTVRYRFRTWERRTHPKIFWKRVSIIGIAAVFATVGVIMAILLLKK